MKIKDYKCKCGHNDFFFMDKGNQRGIYCTYCGKWLKWADKDEQNLAMKQESMLDNIRTEIADLEEDISSYHNDRPWVFKDEVLQIIDRYNVKSEG